MLFVAVSYADELINAVAVEVFERDGVFFAIAVVLMLIVYEFTAVVFKILQISAVRGVLLRLGGRLLGRRLDGGRFLGRDDRQRGRGLGGYNSV